MGLFSRMMALFRAKMGQVLDRAEDPATTLDYSYERQLELLQKVRRGIVDVVTARRRLEEQVQRLHQDIGRLEGQARQALALGREDLARLALQRQQVAQAQLQTLTQQLSDLEREQARLQEAEQRLRLKVEVFRTRKEALKAQYQAAEAQVRIGEAVTGLSEEMADIGLAIQRVEERTAQMRARASAIDELVAVGTLTDLTTGSDALEAELQRAALSEGVEQKLAALKRELGGGESPRMLGEGKDR